MLNGITRAACLLFAMLPALVQPAFSMEFTLRSEDGQVIDGHEFPAYTSIYASGAIVPGDADRLLVKLKQAGRDEFGNIRIYYDSPGGNVGEALKMVEMTDFFETTAIVPDGVSCVSACASVLFLSSRIHFIHEGGLLGMHACRLGAQPNPLCNDAIVNNATFHGTPYGSSDEGLKARDGEDEMFWYDTAAACRLGMCGPPTYDPTLAIPSFECDMASTSVSQLVCNNSQLARYDASVARLTRLIGADRDLAKTYDLQASRSAFDARLAACPLQFGCVLAEYAAWRAELRFIYTSTLFRREVEPILARDEEMGSILIATFMYCSEPGECERPFLLDGTHDLFTQNSAMTAAVLANRRERGEDMLDAAIGSLNCYFPELCDPTIKTYNLELLATLLDQGRMDELDSYYP